METEGKCFHNSPLHARGEGNKIKLYKAESLVVLI